MNKLFALMVVVMAGCTHIEAGHVGVKIDSCSGGGVDQTPVNIGYHATGPCTSIVEYPTYVVSGIWSKSPTDGHPQNEEITFTNSDQMTVAVDISLAYQLDPNKVPAFYAKFRDDEIDGFTHGFLHNLAREKFDAVAGHYRIDQIMGDNTTFVKEVRDSLEKDLEPYGVKIIQFGFVGAPRPPESVIAAINAKTQATQQAIQVENEVRKSKAEAQKKIADAEGDAQAIRLKADAQAYANQKLASSLSPVLVDYLKAQKWDGKMPQVQGVNAGLINLGK